MKYIVSYQNPSTHYVDIEVETSVDGRDKIQFQLPAWRPGRYELGNFAKNIQKWFACDQDGKTLIHRKITKDLWEVSCKGATSVYVRYNYFANELNAGSTFLSERQLYMNPVNCMLYDTAKLEGECELKLLLPKEYKVAIPLREIEKGVYKAKNFDELVDSPFIASADIQHHSFQVEKTTFHLWFQGEFKPDWQLLETDFAAYTKEQIALFGEFPTEEYHYLFQILPHSAYHGVEHSASTVIALGPSYSILKKDGRYEDLLGVSSHELFHTWNVKRIRPVEMVPYDFTKENYTRLGYLAEGATTWYGDVTLYRSKVFDDAAFFRTFNQLLDRHYNNPGSLNLSVADSSFDTWLDGYSLGVPNRKSSIYTEGALITFMLDVEIRRNSDHKYSFDDVLRAFYKDFYKQGKGISENDYKNVVEFFADKNLDVFFKDYVNGARDFTDKLIESLGFLGMKFDKKPSDLYHESHLGIKINEGKIIMIYPDSVAEKADLSVLDKIITVNAYVVNEDLSQWLEYFKNETICLGLLNAQGEYKEVRLTLNEELYFTKNIVSWQDRPSPEQEKALKAWRHF